MIGSVTSGLLNNLADIGLGRVLAITPFVGMFGPVIFMSSSLSVRTFESLTRKTTAKFAEHEVMYGKPVSEFTGMDLDSLAFEIVLHSGLGVEPLTEFELLKRMCESGKAQNLFLHGKKHGNFTIRNLEGEEKYWLRGRPALMVIALQLRENVDSLPTEAKMKLREDELQRSDTGIGGPDRLPGTANNSPSQDRNLTPSGWNWG